MYLNENHMAMHLLNSLVWVSTQEHTCYPFETLVRLKIAVLSVLGDNYFLRQYNITELKHTKN